MDVQFLIRPAYTGQKCDQSDHSCPSLKPSEIVFDVVPILCFWLEVRYHGVNAICWNEVKHHLPSALLLINS